MTAVALDETTKLLGLPDMDEDELVQRVREGLPTVALQVLREAMALQRNVLLALLDISDATARRRAVLKRSESDRTVRLARVFAYAEDVFENRETARTWLRRPNRALAGNTPLSLLDTDLGVRQVETELGRIEYGVFA